MANIPLNIESFRLTFDAFRNAETHPDARLNAQYVMATCYVSNDANAGFLSTECRELALQLMLAHLLYLGDLIASGGNTGQIVGASEDGVSVSLTPPPNEGQFAWWLNTSPYGQQLNTMLENNTIGGVYLGSLPEQQGFRKIGGIF